MKIKLDETVYLTDGYNESITMWETVERKKKETEEVYMEDVALGYFADVPQACRKYVKKRAREATKEDAGLQDYVDNVIKQVERLESMGFTFSKIV